MTITAEQITTFAGVIAAIVALYTLFSKPFKTLKNIDRVTTITAKQVALHGEMIAGLLDPKMITDQKGKHLASLKKQYDEEYRRIVNKDLTSDTSTDDKSNVA